MRLLAKSIQQMNNAEFKSLYEDLKRKIYADDWRNYGTRTSVYFKLSSNKSRMLVLLRFFEYLVNRKVDWPWLVFHKLVKKICLNLLYIEQRKLGVDIHPLTQIGEGLHLPHPNGIVLHGGAVIGNNCTIMQQVTVGGNMGKEKDMVATIGDNVILSAGAKVIGPCAIGNNVIVGANAVVIKDVPDNSVVGGVPARLISHNVFPPYRGDY